MVERDSDATKSEVDLALDLIEGPTRVTGIDVPKGKSLSDIDEIESARILVSEGLHDEAKKILRAVIMKHPDSVQAREILQEIQKVEIQALLGDAKAGRSAPSEAPVDDPVLDRLEEDLGLAPDPGTSLLGAESDLAPFLKNLERELQGAPDGQRVDLAVAFLEMDLPMVTLKILEKLHVRRAEALVLMAQAELKLGRPVEAAARLQEGIHDPDLSQEERIEFQYLLGRAYERLGRAAHARTCYEIVVKIDQSYRDAAERLKMQDRKTGRA